MNKLREFFRNSTTIALLGFMSVALILGSCATTIDKKNFKLKCKRGWKGKNIFIDFDTNAMWGDWQASADITSRIRDQLIEDVVEDQCFNIYDGGSGGARGAYLFKVSIKVANPRVFYRETAYGRGVGYDRPIDRIYATFRIKTYDSVNRVITAKSREVEYKSPMLVVTVNDSQRELVSNYAHNASQAIRQEFYKSLR